MGIVQSTAAIKDTEKGKRSENDIKGYQAFSAFVSSDPDLQVYRRFDRLCSRNLLYLQSEILELEARLEEFDDADAKDATIDLDVMLSARCWESFARKAKAGNVRERERMLLIKQIRELIKEYRKHLSLRPTRRTLELTTCSEDALLRQSGILRLEDPSSRVRNALTKWFAYTEPLIGYSRDPFNDARDLVALRTAPDQDRLSLFLQDHLGYLFRVSVDHQFSIVEGVKIDDDFLGRSPGPGRCRGIDLLLLGQGRRTRRGDYQRRSRGAPPHGRYCCPILGYA